jgi:acyl carrier protein
MISSEALAAFLQQFLLERGVVLPADWQSYNFVSAGVLDSFEILTLIVSLETHFGFKVPASLLAEPANGQLGTFVAALQALA